MQCENVFNGELCTRQAMYNSNFCTICSEHFHSLTVKAFNKQFGSGSDKAFSPHSDKLTKAEKTFINGLGNKPKPVIKKEKPVMDVKPRKMPDPSLLTISEVASLLRVSTLTLKRWGKLGKINCIRINTRGDRRYLRTEITRLLEGKV